MSIFSDIDWDSGSDNPWELDPGTYQASISDAEITTSMNQNKGLRLIFTTDSGGSIQKWNSWPDKEEQDATTYKRNVSFMRMLFRNLEIPEDQWDKIEPNDFIGLDCIITVTKQKKDPTRTQITQIARAKGTPYQSQTSGKDFTEGLREFTGERDKEEYKF